MKNIGFIALLCSFFISSTLVAIEAMTGGYTTKNREIRALINYNDDFAFAYGLLRRAYEIESPDFITAAHDVWWEIKHNGHIEKAQFQNILINNWDKLTIEQKELAIDLGLVKVDEDEKIPNFWDKSEQSIGPNCTTVLKIITGVAIVSCFVVTPVAATVMPFWSGTFRDSCKDIKVNYFRSTDPNIAEHDLSIVSARCDRDRSCHDAKYNEIVIPVDGSTCINLHNDNGTLLLTDSLRWTGSVARDTKESCPLLEGSFSKSCDTVSAEPYMSSDRHVPSGSFCQYEVSCNKKGSGKKANTLYLPKAAVNCKGKLIENCDGHLKVRKGYGDDHQCDDNWQGYQSEL